MKVFITGVAGFVGRSLVEALLVNGHEVIGFIREDLSIRKPETHMYLEKNIKLVFGDLTDFDSILNALNSVSGEEGITVVHLAAVIDTKKTRLFQAVNIAGTENFYNAVLQTKTKISHIIHVSTAAVHGPNHPNEKITEETSILPETYYEKSKYESESIARRFVNENNLPITILRPVHVYGPHTLDRLLSHMIKMVRSGFAIAPAKQPLDLINVNNLVMAMIQVMDNREKSLGQTYLLTDDKNYTTDDVIKSLEKIFNIRPIIIHIPKFMVRIYSKLTKKLRYGLNKISYSCDKAKTQLDYKPKVTLDDGLRAYVGWLLTVGHLDSNYILNKREAANESLSGVKGLGCAYDYIIRLKTIMPLYRKATHGKASPCLLLITPYMKFCPPLELAYLKRLAKNLLIRRVVIPYYEPTSSQIQKYLMKHENRKYDLSLYVGEDLSFDALKTLTEKLRALSQYVAIFVHNGDNTYHIGGWKGIPEKSVISLGAIGREHIDVPLIPANIKMGLSHKKTMSAIRKTVMLSLCLTILLISKIENKFPRVLRKKMSHQLFLFWDTPVSC
ncbi:NAD(P)-dependent oxidoreductase [Candidatus Bathyarchaeota archaeon]|nr:NAD(P)-dependent oxidoreductase [Candidatus Bathyarchaeota archaeon]